MVDAIDKKDAIDKMNADPNTLETTIVKKLEQEGWLNKVKEQVGL